MNIWREGTKGKLFNMLVDREWYLQVFKRFKPKYSSKSTKPGEVLETKRNPTSLSHRCTSRLTASWRSQASWHLVPVLSGCSTSMPKFDGSPHGRHARPVRTHFAPPAICGFRTDTVDSIAQQGHFYLIANGPRLLHSLFPHFVRILPHEDVSHTECEAMELQTARQLQSCFSTNWTLRLHCYFASHHTLLYNYKTFKSYECQNWSPFVDISYNSSTDHSPAGTWWINGRSTTKSALRLCVHTARNNYAPSRTGWLRNAACLEHLPAIRLGWNMMIYLTPEDIGLSESLDLYPCDHTERWNLTPRYFPKHFGVFLKFVPFF